MSAHDLAILLGSSALIGFVALWLIRLTNTMPATTRAFRHIAVGELFYDGAQRWRRIVPAVEGGHNAISQGSGVWRMTTHFNDSDRFEVLVPLSLQCALWRRVLVRYSLGWQLGGWKRLALVSWRVSRILSSEQTEMALAAYATSLLMLGDD